MKVTSATLGPRSGARLIWSTLLVSMVLGIALALLLVPGSATADGPNDFLAPIVLEEGRTPPKVVDPPGVRVQRQVQGQGASITQTPVPTKLVGNTGQSSTVLGITFTSDHSQAFTTGSNSLGYKLTHVAILLGHLGSGQQAAYSVYIAEDSGGRPGASLGTLSGSPTLTNTPTAYAFTATGDGIDLEPDTTYWVVVDADLGGATNTGTRVAAIDADGEDSDGAAGWSMANNLFYRAQSQTSVSDWKAHTSSSLALRVNGYEKTFADVTLTDNFDCNAYLGWEHTNGRQWDSADRVWRQVGSYYFTGQYANTGEPICERRFSSAGPGSYADKLGYGMTLCSLAPTWQTVDPETGEAVGGPDRVHETGHLTSSGQKICSDFDGLRSTKKYIQEQQLKQLCSREPTHALCN